MAATLRDDVTSLFTLNIVPQAIPTLENKILLYALGEPKPIPVNSGDNIQVQIYDNLTPSTTPAHELVTGLAASQTFSTATMRVRYYANDVQFSQWTDLVNEANFRDSAFGRLIFNAAEVADLLARDVLDDMTTNVQVVNNKTVGTDLAATDTHNISEINDATTTLQVANADPHRMGEGKFIHVIASRVAGDLRGDTGGGSNPNAVTWYDIQRRLGNGSAIEDASMGATHGCKILVTSAIQRLTDSNSITYYNNFVIADNLFMTGWMGGLPGAPESVEAARTLIHLIPPEYSPATPHGNLWILSWDYSAGVGLIDDNRGVLLQSASAA